MNKKIWDVYAPVYKRAMQTDERAYALMYRRIPKVIKNKNVLEIATGPGLLALHVASSAKSMIATDYSEGMIREAKKNDHPANLRFEVADATNLPYEDNSFDVVIIANALHVMPDPEKALEEIHRVLRPRGILIAPNFVNHGKGVVSRLWSGVLKAVGISFEHQWSADGYNAFLEEHGWRVVNHKLMKARIPMMYTECVEKK